MAQAGMNVRRRRQKTAQERARERRIMKINAMMTKVAVALIAICMFVYIGRMTTVAAGAKEIDRIEQEIEDMKEWKQYLEVNLAARQNINRVKDEAIGRLGMIYPQESQIYLISLNGYAANANTQTAHDGTNP